MRRLARAFSAICLAALVSTAVATPAGADFGFKGVDVTFTGPDGGAAMQAGSHPFAMTTTLAVNTKPSLNLLGVVPDGEVKDLSVSQPVGFVGDPWATPRCSTADFLTKVGGFKTSNCPDSTAVGVVAAALEGPDNYIAAPVFNLVRPPGVAAKLGFTVLGVPVTIDAGLNPNPPYNLVASLANVSQAKLFFSSQLTLWGNPAHPSHDPYRGTCVDVFVEAPPPGVPSRGNCPSTSPERPFLTLPRSCNGPLVTTFEARSWQNPGAWVEASATTHDDSDPPNPLATSGCGKLGFAPRIVAQPTTDHAESPSGLDVNVEIEDQGLTNPDGLAHSDIKKAVVTLPAGVTANPSVAEGLAACSPADYARETVSSEVGEGCPQASKLGTIEVETPLLEGEILKGSLFIAQSDDPATATPGAENPFDSFLALYMVIKDPDLGILVKLAGKVEPSEEPGPNAGRLTTTFDDLPQLPVSDFRLHFREGGRSPLVSPPGCGTYTTEAELTPWANPAKPLTTTSSFQISRGVGGGLCPPAGVRPFKPGFVAGTINNDAGSYSPFYMRLTRADGEQDMTKFSTVLPPGLLGRLAGVAQCPDAAIAAARTRTGRQELAAPICPESSQIGRTLAGAGAGSQLTYVGGKLFLAGPVGDNPLSVAAIVPAVAGPFDAGTVVVRVALTLNPKTAEVEIDGAASEPIPHILKGIPLKVRDLRIYADRPKFTLNPTSCKPFETRATLFGSFADVFDPADDSPVSLAAHFQAANCANLGFKPRFSLRLKGGTKRGDHPALRAVVRPRPKNANFARAVVTLPRSAFLDQGHIRTICTRVQFAAKACPKGSIYGHATASSPLLDKPLKGPVYLRSSNHALPDLVAALHGIVDIDLVGRIDSHRGGIRSTFERIPDAPVTRFVLRMQGGEKGLIVNSRDLCADTSRATARLTAQNGRRLDFRPPVRAAGCKKQR